MGDKGMTDLIAPITYAGAVELEFVVGRMLKALFAAPVSAQKGKKSGVSLSSSSSSRVMMWKREGEGAEDIYHVIFCTTNSVPQ